MSKTHTTAAELIAMLQELPPETHVFVDVGNFDWGHSDAIRLTPASGWIGKPGAIHLTGLEAWEVEVPSG